MITQIVLPGVWTLLVLAFLAFLGYLLSRRQQQSFNEHVPPISDDQFMARCPPGTNREIALKVRRIVAEQLFIEYERIYPEHSFVNDLGAD